MHICLTTLFSPWSPYSGGGQRSTHNLATSFASKGHDVDVIYARAIGETIKTPDTNYRMHWAKIPGLRSKRDASLRSLTGLSVAKVARQLIRPHTVLHSNGEEGAWLGRIARSNGSSFILTSRYGSFPNDLDADHPSLSTWLKYSKFLLLRKTAVDADMVVPPSRFGADLMIRTFNLPPSKFRVVHNGAPREFLNYHRVNATTSGPIVFFGRFAHDKGVDILIEAVNRLAVDPPEVLLIGRGPDQRLIESLVKSSPRSHVFTVKDWATPDEIGALLEKASMAVIPSRAENFSTAVLGAMATGAPVISTRVGGTAEVIRDGETGLLVDADDPDQLARAMTRLLSDRNLNEAIGVGGRNQIRRHFTWDVAATKFEELYAELGAG